MAGSIYGNVHLLVCMNVLFLKPLMAWRTRLAHFAIEFGFCMSCRVLFIVLGKGVRRTAKEKVCALTNGHNYSSVSHALIVFSLHLPLRDIFIILFTVLSSNSLQPTHGYVEEQKISDMVILDPGTIQIAPLTF